jgi:hypothetical protein
MKMSSKEEKHDFWQPRRREEEGDFGLAGGDRGEGASGTGSWEILRRG